MFKFIVVSFPRLEAGSTVGVGLEAVGVETSADADEVAEGILNQGAARVEIYKTKLYKQSEIKMVKSRVSTKVPPLAKCWFHPDIPAMVAKNGKYYCLECANE